MLSPSSSSWAGSVIVGLCVAAHTILTPDLARAESDATDKAAAAALFDEARRLLDEGKAAEACPKLAESQKLDPTAGTALNLGDCYERMGRTASAFGAFDDAAARARQTGDAARAAEAERRAKALGPKLSMVVVNVPQNARIEGLTVLRGGKQLGAAVWGTPVPVDPGEHTIEATAPGKPAWKTTVQLTGPGTAQVTVPVLGTEAVKAPAVTPRPPPATQGMSGKRIGGIVVGGVGLAAIGVGVGFAVAAANKDKESTQYCPVEYTKCYAPGVSLRNEAITLADTSTVVTILGGVALGTGVALFILGKSPSTPERPAKAWVMPTIGSRFAGIGAGGSW